MIDRQIVFVSDDCGSEVFTDVRRAFAWLKDPAFAHDLAVSWTHVMIDGVVDADGRERMLTDRDEVLAILGEQLVQELEVARLEYEDVTDSLISQVGAMVAEGTLPLRTGEGCEQFFHAADLVAWTLSRHTGGILDAGDRLFNTLCVLNIAWSLRVVTVYLYARWAFEALQKAVDAEVIEATESCEA